MTAIFFRINFVLSATLVVAGCAQKQISDCHHRADTDSPKSTIDRLAAKLTTNIEWKNGGSRETRRIEFCPDNTCDIFEVNSKALTETESKRLFVLYLSQFSGYFYLEAYVKDDEVRHLSESEIKAIQYKPCANQAGPSKLKCILLDEEKQGNLRYLFSRFDEGQDTVARVPLRDLAKIKAVEPK